MLKKARIIKCCGNQEYLSVTQQIFAHRYQLGRCYGRESNPEGGMSWSAIDYNATDTDMEARENKRKVD